MASRPGGTMPRFIDDAEAAGLRFTFENGLEPGRQMPETMSGGVGLIDYDGDGWLDVYCRPGRAVPSRPGRSPSPSTAATGCSATAATGRSRTSPRAAGIAALPARLRPRRGRGRLSITTAIPTCS